MEARRNSLPEGTVSLLKPRGSDGYGEKFYNALAGVWVRAVACDLLESVHKLVGHGVVDLSSLIGTSGAGHFFNEYQTYCQPTLPRCRHAPRLRA